jgi:leucyl aminopeptidase
MKFKVDSLITKKESVKALNTSKTEVYVFYSNELEDVLKDLKKKVSPWEFKAAKENTITTLTSKSGPIVLIPLNSSKTTDLKGTDYSVARETVGKNISHIQSFKSKEVIFDFINLSDNATTGSLVGIELALYRFKNSLKLGQLTLKANKKKLAPAFLTKAKSISLAVNQARHLVNLPPNDLNPVSYANSVKDLYSKSKTISVTVLDEKKLMKENCNLLLGVGMSSDNPPRIVHMKYRPKGVENKKSIALVGKGITFDSGGLDIKSAAGMRFMKKDMGGSACLLGFTRWLETSDVKRNIDIYLALAENAISEKASRPSDIFVARNGMSVEIHNTDAEGRLALADAMDIALDLKPEIMIDVATLTGAGKVALGQDIASLFSNDELLASDLEMSSLDMGDLAWKMPLYSPYFKGLNSEFADMANSASGHGGAITAALFLEKFAGKTKWAHLDIFGWTSGNKPSLVQKGGSGQGVEALIGYFKGL